MRGFTLASLIGVSAAVAVLGGARPGAATGAGQSRSPGIVGSYSIVTHITTPFEVVVKGTFYIDTFNPSTGAITGHGVAERGATYVMTGTVKGRSISMRVSTPGTAPAIDKGTISPDGTTISGTLKQSGDLGQSGTWTMTRLATTVLVRQSGWGEQHLGHQFTDVSWGVALLNPSRSNDAVNVDVYVQAVGTNGKVITDQGLLPAPPLPVIPAGQTFYLGGGSTLDGAIGIRGLRVSIGIGSTPTRRYVLPPVSDVDVDAATGEITATVTNPYGTAISPYDYTANVVLYDRKGRIIGGDDLGTIGDLTMDTIKPGASAPISDYIPDGVSRDRVASARITVTP